MVISSRRRLKICWWGFLTALAAVFGRMAQLEWTQGAGFREEAAKPLLRRQVLDGVRGRILARDGTVLAADKPVVALAVHYRYLQTEPDPQWLRAAARLRLSRAQRKDPQRVAGEESKVAAERNQLAQRLAALCRVAPDEWARRRSQIETRVQRIVDKVNARRGANGGTDFKSVLQPAEPERITVSEELDYHVMAEAIPREVVAEVEGSPQRYPGVRIVEPRRRTYPLGLLACHVLGHLGSVQDDSGDMPSRPQDRVGRLGIERQYEDLLRGRRGVVVEQIDHGGRVVSSSRESEPGLGRDLVLTIDAKLQATAESLLDDALARRAIHQPGAKPAGGAVVVMDCRNGAILAAASAPRFDPNAFAGGPHPDPLPKGEGTGENLPKGEGNGENLPKGEGNVEALPKGEGTAETLPKGEGTAEAAAVLADPAAPLLDRVTRMAIAPGSVFKTLTAIALLEESLVQPEATLDCRGYLHRPEGWRCAIYRRQGIGHGEVALADALAESCNVYFFHHAERLRPERLLDWATRFGFGEQTGVDLPAEAAGSLGHADTRLLAIGQGPLQVTPLQAARMMAAVANGGELVTPHVLRGLGLPPRPIPGLHPATLAAVREGLNRVVCDPKGTGYGTVRLDSMAIAGKTGTAEAGDEGDHAWFAGYVPAEGPTAVVVVALEHAGDGAEAAGPVAKRLVLRLQQLGYLGK